MSIEQGPSLRQLQAKLAQRDQAIDRVRSVREKLSTGSYTSDPKINTPTLDLSSKQGQDFFAVALRVDQVIESIDERTLPRITAYRQRLADEIQFLEPRIAQLDKSVQAGRLTPDFAEEAKRQLLSSLKREVPELSLVYTIPQPEVTTSQPEPAKRQKRAYTCRKPRIPVQSVEPVDLATGLVEDQSTESLESLLPTPRQTAILCNEIQRKNGWRLRHGTQEVEFTVNDDCVGVCQRLDAPKTIATLQLASVDLKKERQAALGAMRDLVEAMVNQEPGKRTEGKKYIFDGLSTEMQQLVIQFMDWEGVFSATNLYAFLADVTDGRSLLIGGIGYDEACVREYTGVAKVWDAPQPFPKREKRPDSQQKEQQMLPAIASVIDESVPETNVVPEATVLLIAEEPKTGAATLPLPEKQTALIRKEEKALARRARLKKCLWKIFEAEETQALHFDKNGLVWGGANTNRVFNWLTTKVQNVLIDGKLVRPVIKTGSRTNGKIPGFSMADIAVALYYHDFDDHITSKIARDLANIVSEITDSVREEFNEQKRREKQLTD